MSITNGEKLSFLGFYWERSRRTGSSLCSFNISIRSALFFMHLLVLFLKPSRMDNECVICCSAYDKRSHQKLECNNCHKSACRTCHQTFLLGNTNEARCMHCNVAWSIVFLYRNFTRSFVVTFRQQQRDAMWNRELFHLPTISEYVENDRLQKQQNIQLLDLQTQILTLRSKIRDLKYVRSSSATKARQNIRKDIHEVSVQYWNSHKIRNRALSQMRTIQRQFVQNRRHDVPSERNLPRNHPCAKEDCRGFVNSSGVCPVCEDVTCLKCNVLVTGNESHHCKPDDVENWKEIRRNTRPCPSCHIPIFKISGCNQMWCVQCHTAFDWKTGTIQRGAVHNPHYFEQLFNGDLNRNLGPHRNQNLCADDHIPDSYQVKQKVNPRNGNQSVISENLRLLIHIQLVVIPGLEITNYKIRTSLFQYLIRHMNGGNNVKKSYEMLLTKKQVYDEYVQLLRTYINQQSYLYRAFLNDSLSEEDLIHQYRNFRMLSNETLQEFNRVFHRQVKSI